MFRDPRDVLKGRIDAKVNQKVFAAKRNAMGAAHGAAAGAAKKAKGGADPAAAQAKKKKKMGWWPFGGEKGGAEGAAACPGCAGEIDTSWAACPYCGTDLGGGAADAPVAAAPSPQVASAGPSPGPVLAPANKTVAIDLEALKGPQRSVVGWIVVMQGSQKGTDFRLYEGTNSIGAAADNDIVITDEYLSSKHAAIRFEDGRYELRDHESTNGSFVNEKKIDREELIDNDSVRFGRTEFRFKALY